MITVRRFVFPCVAWGMLLVISACNSSSPQAKAPASEPRASETRGGNKGRESEASHPTGQIRLAARQQQESGIEVFTVASRWAPNGVTAPGTVAANENRTWHLSSYVLGKVTQMYVGLGDSVKRYDVLARLHSHEVHDSRAAYRQALASQTDARAQEDLASKNMDRANRLFALQAISRAQLELAGADLAKAKASVNTAQAAVQREKVHLLEVLGVPLEDTGLEEAETVPLRSPANGVVIERLASVGTVVNPGTPVLTIADLSLPWVIAAVHEEDVGKVHPNQRVEIRTNAYPDRVFTGKVLKLGESLDPNTRTLQVRVLVPNSDGALKSQMFVSASFLGSTKRPVIEIPGEAIQELNGERVVFVQTRADTFEPRVVNTGRMEGGRVEVSQGLRDGDHVVLKGSYALKTELLKSSLSEDE